MYSHARAYVVCTYLATPTDLFGDCVNDCGWLGLDNVWHAWKILDIEEIVEGARRGREEKVEKRVFMEKKGCDRAWLDWT